MLRGRNQGQMICGSLAAVFAVCALNLVQPAWAVEMEDLYTVQVPFDREDPDARSNAYARAVGEVLIRVTGSESAAESEDLLSLFPNPARYVLQFRPC